MVIKLGFYHEEQLCEMKLGERIATKFSALCHKNNVKKTRVKNDRTKNTDRQNEATNIT